MKRFQLNNIDTAGTGTTSAALNIAMICSIIFFSCPANVTAHFNSADPLLWRETNIPHIAGSTEWELETLILDPCKTLFHDITPAAAFNEKIIENCQTRFKEFVENEFDKLCPFSTVPIERFVFEASMIIGVAVSAVVAGESMVQVS